MQKPNQKWTALDTNAFLHCRQLLQLALETSLCTTSSVLNELKDQKAKQTINSLPFELSIEMPSKMSLSFVREFATKTGDITTLSDVDLQIIAISYDECIKRGLANKLNKQPKKFEEPRIEQNYSSDEDYSDDQRIEEKQQKKEQTKKQEEVKPEDDGWIVVTEKKQKKKKQSSEDDDDGWITPENYNQKKLTKAIEEKEIQEQEMLPVSVMTSDFAMQNVILQIGIGLRSVEGVQIQSVRRFIQQCYTCGNRQPHATTNKIELCSKCGYNSLSKVAYSIDNEGNMVLHRKKNWQPNQKVKEWKERKLEEQERYRKNQRKKAKKTSIFA